MECSKSRRKRRVNEGLKDIPEKDLKRVQTAIQDAFCVLKGGYNPGRRSFTDGLPRDRRWWQGFVVSPAEEEEALPCRNRNGFVPEKFLEILFIASYSFPEISLLSLSLLVERKA